MPTAIHRPLPVAPQPEKRAIFRLLRLLKDHDLDWSRTGHLPAYRAVIESARWRALPHRAELAKLVDTATPLPPGVQRQFLIQQIVSEEMESATTGRRRDRPGRSPMRDVNDVLFNLYRFGALMLTSKIVVDRDFVLSPLDRRVFGTFVEHMGRCVYGGIYEPGHPTADANGFRGDVLADEEAWAPPSCAIRAEITCRATTGRTALARKPSVRHVSISPGAAPRPTNSAPTSS